MVILAAIDGKETSYTVLETAHDLATRLEEELVVVHVMSNNRYEEIAERASDNSQSSVKYPFVSEEGPSIEPTYGGSSSEGYLMDNAVEDAEQMAKKMVKDTLGNVPVTPVGRVGDPTEQILKVTQQYEADYVVIGGRKRSPVGKALFGSTTQSILLNTDRPVITCMHEE